MADRLVLDTSVLVSGYLYRRLPRRVLDMARQGEVAVLASQETTDELARVLAYPKFNLTLEDVAGVMADLRSFAESVEVTDTVSVISEDPADNLFLSLARAGGASYILSGDHHLLALGEFEGIPILSVRDYPLEVSTS